MPGYKQIPILDNKLFFFYFICFFTGTFPGIAQDVVFKRVSVPEGSDFGIITSITQDLQGYMWFAIFNKGLQRYDGYDFTSFSNDPLDSATLASNGIETIYTDPDGIIWIGTQATGLDRLDPVTGIFTHYRHDLENRRSLVSDSVSSMLKDHESMIWVGTVNGLSCLDQKTGIFTNYRHDSTDPASLSSNDVEVIYEDHQGRLWIGTGRSRSNDSIPGGTGGLNLFDRKTGKFKKYLHDPADNRTLLNNRIGAIFEDSKGNFWVSTANEGLHRMDREKETFERLQYDPVHPDVLSSPPRKWNFPDLNLFFIREDGAGTLWFGLSSGSITRYDPNTKKVKHFDSFNNDYVVNTVTDAFTSRDGIVWFTTWGGSIYKVDPFKQIIPHFLTGTDVHSMHEDISGQLWIGTYADGLFEIDRKSGKTKQFILAIPDSSHPRNKVIDVIYEENDSTLWIGTMNGLCRFSKKTNKSVFYTNEPKKKNSLSNGGVKDILGDQPGSLWITTNEGLDHMDIRRGVFLHYRNNPKDSSSLSNNKVTTLYKDHSGNLWIGDCNGVVNRFNRQTNSFRRYGCGTGIVNSIIEDHEKIIWIGTSKGLYRSDTDVKGFSLFTDQGIALTAATFITGVVEDDEKNIWISSSAGILRFSTNRVEITSYGKNQGVDAVNFNFSTLRSKKGRLGEIFFPDKSGYYAFYPAQYRKNQIGPQIVINNFRLADDQPASRKKNSPLTLPLLLTKEIRLKYNQNVFIFEFAGIHYSSPEDNRHLYMLEDYDKNWRKAGPERSALYYNIHPGHYTFRIKAASRDGVWSEKSIFITITPPWWTTWWFRVATGICAAILFYAFIRWRLNQKFRLQLERSEKEKQVANLQHKTVELQMQALRAQMNPHFIFNSLNSINMFILENNRFLASEHLSKFSRLIRMILQHSQEPYIPLEKELDALRLYLELELLRFDQRFEYRISVQDDLDTTMVKVPPLIIQPYVENAIWHGLMHKNEKGHLEIELYQQENLLICKITDDGIGRKRAEELKSKSSLTYKSMGMNITAERIALLQQQESHNTFITVSDVVNSQNRPAGTEVLIKLPINYD